MQVQLAINEIKYLLPNRHLQDLNPLFVGREACNPGHDCVRLSAYTLIHYVIDGKGTLYKNGITYPVKSGEIFVILPHENARYTADKKTPWEYIWVGFDGTLSELFAQLHPVTPCSSHIFFDMMEDCEKKPEVAEHYVTARLHMLLAQFFPTGNRSLRDSYVNRVKDYISSMYMSDVKIQAIAQMLNLDRHYLSKLFKRSEGCSIKAYLTDTRLGAAMKLLEKDMSVADAAMYVGYMDIPDFSRAFKRKYGVTPSQIKKKMDLQEMKGSH